MSSENQALAPLIRNLELRAVLSAKGRAAILALPNTVRSVEAGTYTIREADPADVCGILLSGFAYRQKLAADGSRLILSLQIPGEALDLQNLFLDVSDHSVQMLTRGEIAVVPRAAMQELCRSHADVSHAILVKILVEGSIAREWQLNVGRRNARARAAHLLCELAVRLEAEGLAEEYGYELPMTQEQLGDALGLTSVHVNRTMKSLENDGLIARSRRTISFPDWRRMRHESGFNQRYLHLDRQVRQGI